MKPNHQPSLDAARLFCLHSGHRWRGTSEAGRSVMRALSLVVMLSLGLMTGCVCCYEDTVTRTVAPSQVPDRVLAAFVRAAPGNGIQTIEAITFKRKVVTYDVTYTVDGATVQKHFDRRGNELHYSAAKPLGQ